MKKLILFKDKYLYKGFLNKDSFNILSTNISNDSLGIIIEDGIFITSDSKNQFCDLEINFNISKILFLKQNIYIPKIKDYIDSISININTKVSSVKIDKTKNIFEINFDIKDNESYKVFKLKNSTLIFELYNDLILKKIIFFDYIDDPYGIIESEWIDYIESNSSL